MKPRLTYTTLSIILATITAWGANTFLHAFHTGHNHQGTPVPNAQRWACLATGLLFSYATAYQLWRAALGPKRATGHRVTRHPCE